VAPSDAREPAPEPGSASQHPEAEAGGPEGSPYDWYQRALALLEGGNAEAATVLLERLRDWDPDSTSVLEAYARALFDGRHFDEAAAAFEELAERAPADDYAHYGLGMALWRLQKFPRARDHLAMAAVMRPERAEYAKALTQVRATLRAREETGLPLEGPVSA
jgi:predicted Zn-dependent protease